MPTVLVDFAIQALAGLVGVFVGMVLALLVDRRKREHNERLREAELKEKLERATYSILGSVLKNTAEAKRIAGLLVRAKRPPMIHSALEISVWSATQNLFMTLSRDIDQRVIFTQFFDSVQRLQAFADFHRQLQLSVASAKPCLEDEHHRELVASVDRHLADLAEDLRFCGVVLVSDHGHPVHKRILGIKEPATATAT